MTPEEQKQQKLFEIKDSIELLLDIDGKKIFEDRRWGDLDTTTLIYNWEQVILPIINEANMAMLSALDQNPINNLSNHLNEITQFIGQFQKFSTTKVDNARDQLQAFNKQFTQKGTDLWNLWATWGTYLKVQKINLETLEQKIEEAGGTLDKKLDSIGEATKKRIEVILKEIEKEKQEAQKAQEETTKILGKIRADTGEISVTKFSTKFQEQADKLKGAGTLWLTGGVFFAGATILISKEFFLNNKFWEGIPAEVLEKAPYILFLQNFSTKFLILGVLTALTFWCGKQFNIRENLRRQNQHRADALDTFRSFTDAAITLDGRDQVLLEATRSIFRPLPTGHIKDQGLNNESGSSLIEVSKIIVDEVKPSK